MKRASLPWALLVLLLVPPIAAQTAKNYRITGVVVNHLNGSPIPRCHLTVLPAGRMRTLRRPQMLPQNLSADADAHGRFSLSVPSAGVWMLSANSPGYATQAYEEHEGYSTAIVLTEQAPAMEVQFRLWPEASVSGTVLDEASEAVRGAHVSLFRVPKPGPDDRPQPMTIRSSMMTDDRGYYEFPDLPEGEYKIMVQARPWYAASAQMNRGPAPAGNAGGPSGSSLDPSLDVAYPLTWYPGREDAAQAETLALHPGDHVQGDFQLSPVPAVHLQVLVPPVDTSQEGRGPVAFPMVQQVVSGVQQGIGGIPFPVTGGRGAQGQYEVGGLTPGRYTVRLQGGRGEESRLATVEVTEGGTRTLDFSRSMSDPSVTIHLDGDATDENGTQVRLTNAETGENFFSGNPRFGPVTVDNPRGAPGRGARQADGQPRERVMQVPPGRYEVVLTGQADLYLTGISAQSAETTGRYVKVIGNTALTLHVARGKASVSGFVKTDNQPIAGAMVMLVPAGLGDPKSMTWMARDQTDTDGGFDLTQVIPGQYILLAIDHGWQINWKDPSTLSRYLIHGVPLDLRPGIEVKQDIEAQAP